MRGFALAKITLTENFIRNMRPDRRTEVLDTEAGLMVRAYPSGRKIFAFRMRGKDGRIQNAIVGEYPDVRLSAARLKASALRQQVRNGGNVTAAAQKAALANDEAAEKAIPTFEDVITEYSNAMAGKLRIWEKTKRGFASEAEKRIKAVFGKRLSTRVTDLTLLDFSADMSRYRPLSGKDTASGQVSRARAYLSPVLDWAANRRKFSKVGSGRLPSLSVVDLTQTHDPASDDDKITGRRDRSLSQAEMEALLPLLVWPAPASLAMHTKPEDDVRPIALRFLLLTGARLDEMVKMRWRDFKEDEGDWHKPRVKTVRGKPRQQTLPLSTAAIKLLRSLPTFERRRPNDLVFHNSKGKELGNWNRITKALQRESGTQAWHRHDLRRTAATIMDALDVSARVIDKILAHQAGSKDETVSRALENYLASMFKLDFIEDPQREALEKLADAYAFIEDPKAPKIKHAPASSSNCVNQPG